MSKNRIMCYLSYIMSGFRLPSQAYVIRSIIESCNYSSYLELGLFEGFNFKYVRKKVKRAMGVDIESKSFMKKEEFCCMSTDDFFKKNKKKYDVIFIDACHNYEQVVKDFENSIKILNKNGIILLHDTDPCDKKYLDPMYCENSYKMNDYLEKQGKYQFVTIPLDICGLTMVKLKYDNRYKEFVK